MGRYLATLCDTAGHVTRVITMDSSSVVQQLKSVIFVTASHYALVVCSLR